ncbi:hypothetical protein MJT46_013373 [Ovis ammon polii x Ovis aries]|nr:hypothetical protein MJT46_013373 [Ovis ammon polii x Ovis aries]
MLFVNTDEEIYHMVHSRKTAPRQLCLSSCYKAPQKAGLTSNTAEANPLREIICVIFELTMNKIKSLLCTLIYTVEKTFETRSPLGYGLCIQCILNRWTSGEVLYVGHRPFQCRYCPYSASQKGNLKTHVLCVHRMPFDNSQYPDRRFKRSRVDSEASGNFEDPAAVKAGSSAELTEEGSKAQEERN